MRLADIFKKLDPMVCLKVVYHNGEYEDMTHINHCIHCINCEVETISTEEDGTLVVTVRCTSCEC